MMYITERLLPEADRGYLYFADITIDGDTFTKVGYSRNPNRRFKTDEFDDVEAHCTFKNIIPLMDWMYQQADFTPRNEYWELVLHDVMRKANLQYEPMHDFSGKTECYLLDSTAYKAAIDFLEEQLTMMAPPNGWFIPYK
ncbi:hypothetical protein HNP12_000228 [Aeromonas hydrophila]|uniref:hypothetical protein n=1 Tax=Aeromonas hydrophila TaxID=644 RepID=UPI002169EEEE|nr:hypothetical protein [Aeromonas hydrophila]MCS3766189.1 hypothetical protein [Aeromonas hydrophila]